MATTTEHAILIGLLAMITVDGQNVNAIRIEKKAGKAETTTFLFINDDGTEDIIKTVATVSDMNCLCGS